MKTVYVAAPNTAFQAAEDAAEAIEAAGFGVVSGWHGGWTAHHTYERAAPEMLAAEAEHDLLDLSFASHLLVLENQPDGGSRGGHHTELGIALARHMGVAIIGQRGNVFHYLPDVRRFDSVAEYVEWLKSEPDPEDETELSEK